ncbi:MAG: lipid-A-disaccharide synthase, partial [Alistipes sp.]|nr:lipid-A-disaccharide synthase [Alistipes sp.]
IFLKVPFVSLVNLNLERESVREMVCSHFDIAQAREELAAILCGGGERRRMLEDYSELRVRMGDEGASLRFARRMVEYLKNDKR